MAIAVSPNCFCCLGCCTVLRFSLPFLIIDTIFIAVPFSSLLPILSLFSQTTIIVAFHSRLNLTFVGLPFLLWSCHRHIHFAAKDASAVTTGRRPVFLFIFFFYFSGCRSSRHFVVAVPIVTVQPIAIHIL